MVSDLGFQYQRPVTRIISLSVYTPILQASFGSNNESPVPGSAIGDDE